jgi:hypothetical protein
MPAAMSVEKNGNGEVYESPAARRVRFRKTKNCQDCLFVQKKMIAPTGKNLLDETVLVGIFGFQW